MTLTPPKSPAAELALNIQQTHEKLQASDELTRAILNIREIEFEKTNRFAKALNPLVEVLLRVAEKIEVFPNRTEAIASNVESRMQKCADSFQQKANELTELKIETKSMIATRLWIHTGLFSILSSVVVAVVFSIWEPLHLQQKKDARAWNHFQTKVFPKLDLDTQKKITRTWDSSEMK